MSRQPHEPTDVMRKQVEAMAGYGVPAEDIGRVLGISHVTLRKYYRDELDNGTVKANARVAESLFKKATSDGSQSVTAAIFWLKTRAGWKETSAVEMTGKDGKDLIPDDADPERVARRILRDKITSMSGRRPVTDQQ